MKRELQYYITSQLKLLQHKRLIKGRTLSSNFSALTIEGILPVGPLNTQIGNRLR